MTSFLRLNGIALPVQHDAAELGAPLELGGEARAPDGTPLWSRRVTKQPWSFTTPWLSAAEALAFRTLLTGRGVQVLSFEAGGLYTKKGLAPSLAQANFTVDGTFAKFGTYSGKSTATATNLAAWGAFTSSSPWSVALWVSTDGGFTWVHYVVRSDGAKWVAGVRNDAATTSFLTVTAGGVILGENSLARWFDDVAMFPFLVPLDWPAQIHGFGYPFGGSYPRSLTADGLLIEQNTRTEVIAKLTGAKLGQGVIAGVWHGNLHALSFELEEV